MKKGEEVKIYTGAYQGMSAWINLDKAPTKSTQSLIISVVDEDGDKYYEKHTLSKSSFKLKKHLKEVETITEKLIEDNPKVEDGMRKAARLVARLGVQESEVAAQVFKSFVDEYIELLARNPMKANYFPIKLDDKTYKSFFCDSISNMITVKNKKAFYESQARSRKEKRSTPMEESKDL